MPIKCYKCSVCNKVYDLKEEAFTCELSHETNETKKLKEKLKFLGYEVCDFCDKSYYVYGCERACEFSKQCNFSNGHINFKPVEPLHDKSIKGI